MKLLAPCNQEQETMLAKNYVEFKQQLAYNKLTKVKVVDNAVNLNFSETDNVGTITPNEELTVKATSERELVFSSQDIKIVSASSQKIDDSILHNLNLIMTGNKGAIISLNIK